MENKNKILYSIKLNTRPGISRGLVALSLLVVFYITSCKKFLDIAPPKSQLVFDQVFNSDATASAAISGIYIDLLDGVNFANGSNLSVTTLAGLSADELIVLDRFDLNSIQFEENSLDETNPYITSLWQSMYKVIYECNSVIEGIEKSSAITAPVKAQLTGEALFLRAFTYFYATSLFGKVPIVTTTDYLINKNKKRDESELVYEQIVKDLETSIILLGNDYPSVQRARVNKFASMALLARVYLYQKDWEKAINFASDVIENQPLYLLNENINSVFLANSTETIWQLPQINFGLNTYEGYYFIPSEYLQYYELRQSLVSDFSLNDLRGSNWIGRFFNGQKDIIFPYKYKIQQAANIDECSVVLRLAELYLIRAEARTQMGLMADALPDLDRIRKRSGLSELNVVQPDITQAALLDTIATERRRELFAEWGHRWLDVKRLGIASNTLSAQKINWSVQDTLYPIPEIEFKTNPNLGNQNEGY